MKYTIQVCMILPSCLFWMWPVYAQSSNSDTPKYVNHEFSVSIQPKQSYIKVRDTVKFNTEIIKQKQFRFLLHKNLSLVSPPIKPQKTISDALKAIAANSEVPLQEFVVELDSQQTGIELEYRGRINHPLLQPEQESARSFSGTPGLIDDAGVFLANSSAWYPLSVNTLITFTVSVELPLGWDLVSQGKRIEHKIKNKRRYVTWQETLPQNDIYLVAGRYTEYTQAAGAAQAMVFLRQDDESLAQKYLDATSQYNSMYSNLIGPYPYQKFALVENFWETGYGMPSFTLLGSKIIRFPFIIFSSYPHEILHNWWGNGVFVDYEQGNWAEGLTAYLADHLMKEQRGQGLKHRRSVLQKYTDYVNDGRDFPLTEFRSRHSSATEAVGYGKTLMLFHMLRLQLGDENFTRALQQFYRKFKFKIATFKDIESVFSQTGEQDLTNFFSQWLTRTGAPELRVSRAFAKPTRTGFHLTAVVEQFQAGDAYQLYLPIAVHVAGKDQAVQNTMLMNSKFLEISLSLPSRPLRLDIDPEFDLFRRLDNSEIPASLSQGFGSEKVQIVLPKSADNPLLDAYHKLAKIWQSNQQGQWEIIFDSELDQLSTDRGVWLLGWQNRFVDEFGDAIKKHKAELNEDVLKVDESTYTREQQSIVVSARNPKNPNQTLLWLASDNVAAIPGLARKLPHYRNYSYLAFEGDEPSNVAKRQWPVLESPMTILVQQTDGGEQKSKVTKLKPREPLARLAPVFSESRMLADINYLADNARAGRGLGTAPLDDAATYIAQAFKTAGLKPGGDRQGYFQNWSADVGSPTGKINLKNVIGFIPGANPEHESESVIVSAHYDHLGTGGPGVRAGNENKIHPGADDNASGVAIMLELARLVANKWKPRRNVVFIAFTGEEAGHVGSAHYVKNANLFPVKKIIGVLNLDTVGRLNDNPISVIGTGSAQEWVHIFRGAGFVTGIKINNIADDFGSSDQKSFLAAGVPAVQLFGSAHADYHRPGDTIDKIDTAGMVKTATVLKEATEYLANRENPMTVTIGGKNSGKNQTTKSGVTKAGRRVSVGTVPDFAFTGTGVRITGVIPGSPAEKAGLKEGDILISLRNKPINNLSTYSQILKSLKPGDSAILTYLRKGQQHRVTIKVAER